MAKEEKKEEKKSAEKPKEEKTEEKEGKGSVVTVYGPKKEVLRIMDKKSYGKNFRALAKELAGKVKGRVVKEGRPKTPKEEAEEGEGEE